MFLTSFLATQVGADSYALYYTVQHSQLYAGTGQDKTAFSFIVIYLFLLIVAFLNVLHLFGFHIMLQVKGLTTYEFLTRKARAIIKQKKPKMNDRLIGGKDGKGNGAELTQYPHDDGKSDDELNHQEDLKIDEMAKV